MLKAEFMTAGSTETILKMPNNRMNTDLKKLSLLQTGYPKPLCLAIKVVLPLKWIKFGVKKGGLDSR